MRKRILILLFLVIFGMNSGTTIVLADQSEHITDISEQEANSFSKEFEKKDSERKTLPPAEKEIVNYIEKYFNKQINLNNRTINENLVEDVAMNFLFDFTFSRDNQLFVMIANLFNDTTNNTDGTNWYNSLKNTSERTMTVFDAPTNQNITLYARYIDNKSNKTVVVHNGYRSGPDSLMNQIKMFYEQGYNILIPDARGQNKSGGKYITFGYYEKDDLNQWINQEASINHKQKIILYGLSMGAATTMLSQETQNQNVIGFIEDCGYYSLQQQFKDTLSLVTRYFQYIPGLNQINWYEEQDKLINKLNESKVKPILKFDIYTVLPIQGVTSSNIPKLFIHGDADWFVPVNSINILYNSAVGTKEELIVQGASHGRSFEKDSLAYTNKVRNFLTIADILDKLKDPNLILK